MLNLIMGENIPYRIFISIDRKEVQRLVDVGVLEKCLDSKWVLPTFIIPKKNGTVHFIMDLRQVNKQII